MSDWRRVTGIDVAADGSITVWANNRTCGFWQHGCQFYSSRPTPGSAARPPPASMSALGCAARIAEAGDVGTTSRAITRRRGAPGARRVGLTVARLGRIRRVADFCEMAVLAVGITDRPLAWATEDLHVDRAVFVLTLDAPVASRCGPHTLGAADHRPALCSA